MMILSLRHGLLALAIGAIALSNASASAQQINIEDDEPDYAEGWTCPEEPLAIYHLYAAAKNDCSEPTYAYVLRSEAYPAPEHTWQTAQEARASGECILGIEQRVGSTYACINEIDDFEEEVALGLVHATEAEAIGAYECAIVGPGEERLVREHPLGGYTCEVQRGNVN